MAKCHFGEPAARAVDARFQGAIRNWLLLLAFPVSFATTVMADETPRTGIIDDANVVDAQSKAEINAWLLELEQKTGAQLKVWTVSSTKGQDIYQLGSDTFKRWRLGQKGKNNGALVIISVGDRKWRILTGEGIEDTLPDLYCDSVANQYFLPNFKKGDYSTGIRLGTAALAKAIAKDEGVTLAGMPDVPVRRGNPKAKASGIIGAIVFFFFVLIVIGSISARRGGRYRRGWSGGNPLMWMIIGQALGGGGRRSSWGGSSWGSSFGGGGGFGGGGFGGGGGGSFGGGGAGGSW